MRIPVAPLLVALSLVLSACSVSPLVSGALPLPPVRIVQKGYSFLPPEQPGWVLVKRNAFQVALARQIDRSDGTAAIQTTLTKLAYDGTPQSLLNLLSARAASADNQKRYNTQSYNQKIVIHEGQSCARAQILTLDKHARTRDGGTTPMLLNMVQLLCPLPDDATVGLVFTYSLRYRALKPQTTVSTEAETLMGSIRFSQSPETGLQT